MGTLYMNHKDAVSNGNGWPADDPAALLAYYGRFKLGPEGRPTARWEAANLVTIVAPYTMRPAWDPRIAIRWIRCHRRVAESLQQILRGILAYYGSVERVRAARMHLLGGVYSYRRISGSSRLSLHAWGAAIDLDPDHNPLGWAWRPGAGMMPMAVVELFEAAGWRWGGRFKGRKDCMHFQATG